MIYAIAVLKFKYIHRSWQVLGFFLRYYRQFLWRRNYFRIQNVATKNVKKAKLLPGLFHSLFSLSVVEIIIFLCLIFLQFKNSEFTNSSGTCNLKRFLLQHTNFISWLDFSFSYSVKPNMKTKHL